MASIKPGVILLWGGTNDSIPSGWSRVTALDGRFPKGANGEPGSNGGSDTHSHTSPTHTHTMVNHTHSGQVGRSSGDFETHGGGCIGCASRDAHEHSYTTDSLSGGELSSAITYQSASSLPPYHELIFITPNGTPKQLVGDIIGLFGGGDLPTNWSLCDGDNGTPNLTDKFIRGAGADQDAGATGGALSHSHNVDHDHGSVGHTHEASEGNVGISSDGSRNRGTTVGGGPAVDRNHKHIIYLNSTSETPNSYTGTAGSAEDNVQPLHKLLRAIKNTSGNPSKPRGLIGMWLGSIADIPRGWFLCDGQNGTLDLRGFHIKITATEGNVGNTAGSNTHSHAPSNSHTHTATGSHTHTGSSSYQGSAWTTGADSDGASKPHSHSFLQSCSSQTSTWNSTTIQADASNNEPAFKEVAFIMFKYEVFGGASVLGGLLSV